MSKKRFTRIDAALVLSSLRSRFGGVGTPTIVFLVLAQLCAAGPAENSKLKTESPKLEKPVPGPNAPASRITASPSAFSRNMPFGEAIDILRYCTDPPLNIVVLWRDLAEKADIDKTTPIGMDGVSGIPLRQHLELLLLSVSAGSTAKLGYAVEKGVIIIATTDSLPKKAKTRVYDITDLVSPPANYSWPGLMGPMGFYGGAYGGFPQGGVPNMGYGGYGSLYGSGGAGSYGGPYGGGLYGGYGNYSGYPYGSGGYGYNRAGSLGSLIGTLYGPSGARYYTGPRSAANRRR